MKISIRDKGKVQLSSLYYRKYFSKTIATYCHLLPPSGEKRGIPSEKAEEYLSFTQKNIKKVEEKACGFEHFFVFLQPTGKIPADST